jgi:hypothetical protein
VTTNAIGLTYTLNWFSVYTTTTCNEIDGGLHGDQPLRFCSGYTTTDPHAEAYPLPWRDGRDRADQGLPVHQLRESLVPLVLVHPQHAVQR